MTRLKEQDIVGIGAQLAAYDQRLHQMIGAGLAGIAARGAYGEATRVLALPKTKIAVIPITSGEGVITGFTNAVAHILRFLGQEVFVTLHSDVAGLGEAAAGGAQIVFLANDTDFLAIHLSNGTVAENGMATGRGYGAALAMAARGVKSKKVGVLGAGPVGRHAAKFLLQSGALVTFYDPDPERIEFLRQELPEVSIADSSRTLVREHTLLVEATPRANTLLTADLQARTIVSAPGVPLGLTAETIAVLQASLQGQVVHDSLAIGVATMLYMVLNEQNLTNL